MKHLTTFFLIALSLLRLNAAEPLTAAQINKRIFADKVQPGDFVFNGTVEADWHCTPDDAPPTLPVMDETGAVLLRTSQNISNRFFRAGERVSVTGFITPAASYTGCADAHSILSTGQGPSPRPVQVTAAEFYSGRFNNRLVQVKGFVRNIGIDEIDPNFVFIELRTEGESVFTSMRKFRMTQEDMTRISGALVAVSGFCTPRLLTNRRQLGPILIPRNGLSCVEILSPPPDDPLSQPDISRLRYLRPAEIARRGWHSAKGRILCTWNGGRDALLHISEKAFLRVTFAEGQTPPFGSNIAVCGLPEPNIFAVRLNLARWRSLPDTDTAGCSTNDIKAATLFSDIQGRDQQHPELTGLLVRLIGKVSDLKAHSDAENEFLLDCEGRIVPIILSDGCKRIAVPPAGSTVAVIGHCLFESEPWMIGNPHSRIKKVSIIMRSDGDLTVLSHPPWWTAGRMMIALFILVGLILTILIWNRTLQILATRRGHQLFREKVAHYETSLRVDERTKLAVELHDSLAQNLTGAFMELETAESLAGGADPEMLKHLKIASATIKSCHGELRNCLWDLRNLSLDERNLETAIRKTLAPHIRDAQVEISFNVPRARLSDNTAHAILRIIRELVLNAVRHGRASVLRIVGGIDGEFLRFSVIDNGCGFDPDNCSGILQGHFGLEGIRERAGLLSGALTIESSPGKGTAATVTIPLPPAGNAIRKEP